MRSLPRPAVQLITGTWRDEADLVARVEAALRGGIRWVQLRAKDRSAGQLYAASRLLAPLVRREGGLFVVNDRVDVAIAAGAGGVHLSESSLGVEEARRLLGEEAWIGRSVHSVAAIAALRGRPLDAVQFGPVFDTASKRAFGEPQGLGKLNEAALASRSGCGAAVIAVGGIDADNARACFEAGADAVAVISAIWDADDVEAAARALTSR